MADCICVEVLKERGSIFKVISANEGIKYGELLNEICARCNLKCEPCKLKLEIKPMVNDRLLNEIHYVTLVDDYDLRIYFRNHDKRGALAAIRVETPSMDNAMDDAMDNGWSNYWKAVAGLNDYVYGNDHDNGNEHDHEHDHDGVFMFSGENGEEFELLFSEGEDDANIGFHNRGYEEGETRAMLRPCEGGRVDDVDVEEHGANECDGIMQIDDVQGVGDDVHGLGVDV